MSLSSGTQEKQSAGKINVGLLGLDLATWGGGNDFLRLCAGALSGRYNDRVESTLLFSRETAVQKARRWAAPLKHLAGSISRNEPLSWKRRNTVDERKVINSITSFGGPLRTEFFANNDAGLSRGILRAGCDVVLPVTVAPPKSFPVPWLGYIPDLQHEYFPQFFTADDCAERSRRFREVLDSAPVMIVNARAVKEDIEHFYGRGRCEIVDLPFAPVPNADWFALDVAEAQRRYGIDKTYFIICNQFWVHKSHRTAFEAMRLLNEERCGDFDLICTGATDDYRAPGYCEALRSELNQAGLGERVRFLGHIPKSDQIALLRGAKAVVQPTLFEGGPGGGAIYDAACVGTPAIVSDIPVNRELSGVDVTYFRVSSAEDLAARMKQALERDAMRQTPEQLLAVADERVQRLSDRLLQAITLALGTKRNRVHA